MSNWLLGFVMLFLGWVSACEMTMFDDDENHSLWAIKQSNESFEFCNPTPAEYQKRIGASV